MERKIGEIFEYNGEWYQCLEEKTCTCFGCDFRDYNCDDISLKEVKGSCQSERRKDNKSVIFKKLEKVGETYEKRVSDGTSSTFQRYRVYNSVILPKEPYIYCNFIDSTIEIEIKQNKENMEDNKLNLKPFDIQKAKEGKPVCTRDGRKARIISFDREFIYEGQNYCIVALINDGPHNETVYSYTEDGLYNPNKIGLYNPDKIHNNDLMMLPEKRSGWINIRKDSGLFKSREEAERNRAKGYATVMIEFEI